LAPIAETWGFAKAFPRDVGPLAAAEGFDCRHVRDFMLLIAQRKEPVFTFEVETPHCQNLYIPEDRVTGVQMLAHSPSAPRYTHQITELNGAYADQILNLAQATRPGPFSTLTHTLGDFIGIIKDDRLIAMAGQRLKVPGFTEISAVCVDPTFRGQGIGAELVSQMSERILDSGNVPFLHAYETNTSAISLYQNLGFAIRARLQVTNWVRNAIVQYG
jgi:ribosomal protein S18 acetylase RimI-like enzyme